MVMNLEETTATLRKTFMKAATLVKERDAMQHQQNVTRLCAENVGGIRWNQMKDEKHTF